MKLLFTLLILCISYYAMADLAMDSYNSQFYVVSNGVGYYVVDSQTRQKPGRTHFWQTCESIEVIEDAYEKTKSSIYKSMIGELINGLNQVVSGTEDWASWNTYNDDIMWGVIVLVRSYQLTGNSNHLSQAEIQFNKVWERGWDYNNGGMYWNTDKQTKNACVNGPTAIAGFLLGQSTTGTGFYGQAKDSFNWLYNHLYNKDTGQVADHVDNSGTITWWAFTYNQGTFLGAAVLYYQLTGDSFYTQQATKAANWAKDHLTGDHISSVLNDEDDSDDGDGTGFKGIFARWTSKYLKVTGDQTIRKWLDFNAQTAWGYRNSKGVTWTQWWHRTPDDKTYSFACSSAAAIFQACQTCNITYF